MESVLDNLIEAQNLAVVQDTPVFNHVSNAQTSLKFAVAIVQSASETLTVSLLSEDQYDYDLATGEGMPEPVAFDQSA